MDKEYFITNTSFTTSEEMHGYFDIKLEIICFLIHFGNQFQQLHILCKIRHLINFLQIRQSTITITMNQTENLIKIHGGSLWRKIEQL